MPYSAQRNGFCMHELVDMIRERIDTSPDINHMYQSRCDNYYYRLQKLKNDI